MMLLISKLQEKVIHQTTIWLPILYMSLAYILYYGIFLDYIIVYLGVNYFQFGAVRRGLVGSIIYLSGVNLVFGAFLLYGISLVFFITVAFVVLRRMPTSANAHLPFVVVLGALLLFWSTDVGRTDM